ncbi:hypothetical protein [Roseomonas rosulenta]|uniref:hypothetical protein n=1 Tax=Roseomonas rosulenta TaxID=2748667 RepID=UPI0018E05341|nr:hypothetical protein [Roseomonas rosulenta]
MGLEWGAANRGAAWGSSAAVAAAFGAAPHRLHRVAEPCTLRSANGRVRDGLMREAGATGAVVAGVGGLALGQEVDLVLPRRGGLRLRARIAGIGVLGLLLDLPAADCAAEWRHALLGMTEGSFRAA